MTKSASFHFENRRLVWILQEKNKLFKVLRWVSSSYHHITSSDRPHWTDILWGEVLGFWRLETCLLTIWCRFEEVTHPATEPETQSRHRRGSESRALSHANGTPTPFSLAAPFCGLHLSVRPPSSRQKASGPSGCDLSPCKAVFPLPWYQGGLGQTTPPPHKL